MKRIILQGLSQGQNCYYRLIILLKRYHYGSDCFLSAFSVVLKETSSKEDS